MADTLPPLPLLPDAANVRVGWNHAEILPFYGPAYTADQMRQYAAQAVAEAVEKEKERLCAAIKVADDKAVEEAGYMLDSDDCISVIRGTWPHTTQPPRAGQGEPT